MDLETRSSPDTHPGAVMATPPVPPSLGAELLGTFLLLGLALLVTVGVAVGAQALLRVLG